MRGRAWIAAGALLVVLPMLPVPQAGARSLAEIQAELDDVRTRRAALEDRIAAATEELELLRATIATLEEERDALERQLRALRRELDELRGLVSFRVRETFKRGAGLDPIAVFLASDDPEGAFSRAEVVQRVVAADRARGESLTAARSRIAAAEERLGERTRELEQAEARQVEVAAALQEDFGEAERLEASLSAEARAERERLERLRREREARERAAREARQRAAATAASSGGGTRAPSGGMACPLDQPRHFTDTWGAARSGGRRHRGTDIMGPHGIPVRAIVDGVWRIQRPGANAGLWAILHGNDGNRYWYLHLASHTVGNGARVTAGQQVATNGATGNAPRNAPHVHFELHPGGGSAVNPYPLLRRVCG